MNFFSSSFAGGGASGLSVCHKKLWQWSVRVTKQNCAQLESWHWWWPLGLLMSAILPYSYQVKRSEKTFIWQ